MVKVKIEDGTVPYNIKNKYKSARIMLHPASRGT
jgi:ribosomal protein S5